jgi:hypothetical protein
LSERRAIEIQRPVSDTTPSSWHNLAVQIAAVQIVAVQIVAVQIVAVQIVAVQIVAKEA